MSHNAPPAGYRSWLHYAVERVRDGSITIKESLEELEALLRLEDEARQDEFEPSLEDAQKVLAFFRELET